jgi:hypothetical protein
MMLGATWMDENRKPGESWCFDDVLLQLFQSSPGYLFPSLMPEKNKPLISETTVIDYLPAPHSETYPNF